MKITLKAAGKVMVCSLPYATAQFVEVSLPCVCGATGIRGNGRARVETERSEEEDAVCASCGVLRGRIHVELATLFGRTEDDAVLNGRPRVYCHLPPILFVWARAYPDIIPLGAVVLLFALGIGIAWVSDPYPRSVVARWAAAMRRTR